MATRIRTLNFLPEIFKTETNAQFLAATLDQLVSQPNTKKIEGYVGSKFGYGINANDYYVTEPTKIRTDYQLEPGVAFLKENDTTATDFISYPGIIDSLKLEGALTDNNNRLFNSEFYSWDSFTNLDKIINFNQYYWLPTGPERVVVATDIVYNSAAYVVQSLSNEYLISSETLTTPSSNPSLTLLRGGTYTFTVNQNSQFWIQGVPGVTGYSPTQRNVQTRDVYGVTNNGAENGIVTFTVPQKDALNEYNFPLGPSIGVISTLPFSEVNGALVNDIGGIDGVTALNGLTVMFYNTGIEDEIAYVNQFYDQTTYDQDGGVAYDSLVDYPGTSIFNNNYEGGYYTTVNANFYTITLLGDQSNPQIQLTPTAPIPNNQIITPLFGTQFADIGFYRNSIGTISPIPYNSAILDRLYYQDGSNPNKVGVLKIVDSNVTNTLNILTQILGRSTYTAPNGVVFSNGLKVLFQGDIYPESYNNVEYYVEGVGTAIELIPVTTLVTPGLFSEGTYIPYDTLAYDVGNYDSSLNIPVEQDYITIARNAINKNAWSRSNRWFHIDVIRATALYNNSPDLVTQLATLNNKANRPIIEFYPNLRLFDSGAYGKPPIDFLDTRTTDAFSQVAGQTNYYPDVAGYTTYNATIAPVTGAITTKTATSTTAVSNEITLNNTTGVHINDTIVFGGTVFGGIASGTTYYITNVIGNNITISTTKLGTSLSLTTSSGTMTTSIYPYSTTITIPTSDVSGLFEVGQYISDSTNLLPTITFITDVTTVSTDTVITVSWDKTNATVSATSVASVVTADTPLSNYALFEGSRVVFASDTNLEVRNKIYVSHFSTISGSSTPIITLTEAEDGLVLADEQTAVYRGYTNRGKDFYFDGLYWNAGQQKTNVNQPPKFDVLDSNNISFGNPEYYLGTSFTGCTLFAFGIGTGANDSVLGFPLRYSSVDNVGDISFDVTLNSQTFTYVDGTSPITQNVNTGYIFNYLTRTEYVRELGWQTAVSPSVQYQVFEFNWNLIDLNPEFVCDVSATYSIPTNWPLVQVYINNTYLPSTDYTVTITDTTTTIDIPIFTINSIETVIQVLVLSDQVSKTAYYQTPINLNNNPLNQDITTANIGDIRGQYQSIFFNNPNTTGEVFGPNNYRDLGNLVPWGNRIIQNGASLVLPGAFLRKQNHNLFNSILYNSRQYIGFKNLLIDTVNTTDYSYYMTAAAMLDDALDKMNAPRTDSDSFFWSDMLPQKAPYITNTYSFANSLDVSIYPLSTIYNYATANYNGILVYLVRNGVQTQLIKNVDYTISSTSPALTVTKDLLQNDQIIINEYNQTYGSFAPNTPTKLGLYPATIPNVTLDTAYVVPTYFIVGHDGSYNKLYGEYNSVTGKLEDFRDQVLLEFETRVYNNLKLSNTIPIQAYEVLPGFFRNTGYSYAEFLQIYSESFLNWVGQNRVDYKTQLYSVNGKYSYNYTNSGNRINGEPIEQGYFRGMYLFYYDTSTPNVTPWEMLGYANQPTWWETRYGPAPYTSDNLVLWGDLAAGEDWGTINPVTGRGVVLPRYVRNGLLNILPVDSSGNLVPPLDSVVGNYDENTFRNNWQVGDVGPTEFSYRRSSSWPFDLMRILALTKPAEFFNLGVDVDNYKYNSEFDQYLVNNRSHLVVNNIPIYGNGTPATSYINWIVDFEKQVGVDATTNITTLLDNLDVRLVYRLAGFSDKNLLKFYVEKSSANSNNSSLLIPDESYSVLLYDNQAFDRIVYSGVVIQIATIDNDPLKGTCFRIFGNSQTNAYFKILAPSYGGQTERVTVEGVTVTIANTYSNTVQVVPYGTTFYTVQEVAQFLSSYGKYLENQGVKFDQIENGVPVNWSQMIAEFLYWSQTGWDVGSITTLNPSANTFTVNKDSYIVQPLTFRQLNFVLNQNLYPIQSVDLSVVRNGTIFDATPLNQGDTIAYGQFNISNIEHGVVFDNVTLFNDIIYNLVTGLRQNRIYLRGTKTADWDGTMDAYGFILNQDNIVEWSREVKYSKGSIVKYKNKYWTALTIIQAKELFDERDWRRTDYNEIQKGLLPNSQTRSYESTLYYDINNANLENDADLLSFSLIGYRPRDYMALADLTDITQINVYQNMIKDKGTLNAASAFKGATLAQGGIDYDLYENWAIKSGEFGGILNDNFIEFQLKQSELTGNPSIVGLTNGVPNAGVQQEVPIYSITNYGRQINNVDVLPTIEPTSPSTLLPSAGYVNFNDVKMASYFYSGLSSAINSVGTLIPINKFYVRDYAWLANYLSEWKIFTPASLGAVTNAKNNLNNTVTITFSQAHNLSRYQLFAIVNFDASINNYYIVAAVVDPFNVIINLALNPSIRNITGLGIGFKLQNQRVATAPEIGDLPLLDNEFNKLKVWVDTNNDGSWAVFRKSLNYQFEKEILNSASQSFGSAVAYTTDMGYLIGDADAGEVYRYKYDPITDSYLLNQTLSNGTSFGSTISYTDDLFVISEPTDASNVYIYQLITTLLVNTIDLYQTIAAPLGVTNWGSSTTLSGDKNWLYISDIDNNSVHVYRKSTITDLYEPEYIIDGDALSLTSAGDDFGYSISTDYYGDTVVIGTPFKNYNGATENYGYTYVFDRTVQNFEIQNTSQRYIPLPLSLAWTPTTVTQTATATDSTTDRITVTSSAGFSVGDPVIFSGTLLSSGALGENIVYYVYDKPSATTFRVALTRDAISPIQLNTESGGSMVVTVQTTPLFVTINGTLIEDNNYAVIGSVLYMYSSSTPLLNAGDIVNVSGINFVLAQTLDNGQAPRVGVEFGTSVDTNKFANEILVGAPFELNSKNYEGAVHRFTNGGESYGIIIGTSDCNITTPRNILLNGYSVSLPVGNATAAAQAINLTQVTNVNATALDGKLIIQLINIDISTPNNKLSLTAVESVTFAELGINVFTETQVVTCPHPTGRTQFGTTIKFDKSNSGSFISSAPVGARFAATTFDFTDDELDNDTVFDNNATQWVDTFRNAGAVYMFDYLSTYNESLSAPGKFVYAQSTNAKDLDYGSQPYYGTALDFNDNRVTVGTPNFAPTTNANDTNGQVITYVSLSSEPDWAVFRSTSAIVDVNSLGPIQLFSASTNQTLENLDYFDPLQGKLLGAIQQNIDVISNVDPAGYNSPSYTQGNLVWGPEKLGMIWFNTNNTRFMNYHQNDVTYNSQWWGRVFPGSDVSVYSWVVSNVPPAQYPGPGVPFSPTDYSVQGVINAEGLVVPVYYFWARNTNTVFTRRDKTLADTTLQLYIANPQGTGISYFSPLLPNVFGLYNCFDYVNGNDTTLHIGYATANNDDVAHNQYSLIRANYADDFLPGVPGSGAAYQYHGAVGITEPTSLYNRMLDSMCGVDNFGAVVPNPLLPKLVQTGVLAKPRQGFFYDRFGALQNYLQYANEILAQYPITETRNAAFLSKTGTFYDTKNYWNYINWWATGYNNNTKSSLQVSIYADLSTLDVAAGTIVTVAANSAGNSETYIYNVDGTWTRIGLTNGTIEFSSYLWDYPSAKLGFGDNFFDTNLYDEYPSEETRNIVRALNEEIYTNELLIHRNKSLILLFEYIQSETVENQNYLPWLNKTSLMDVSHTIRELLPLEVFRSDNQDFLAGYINEVKPYHVVIKEFLFKYTKTDVFEGDITDFDIPSQFNTTVQQFISPELVYANPSGDNQFLPTDPIWQTAPYSQWFSNYGLSIGYRVENTVAGETNYPITKLASYVSLSSNSLYVDNVDGFPVTGSILIGTEEIAYSSIDLLTNQLLGLARGYNSTTIEQHIPGEQIYIDLPAVIVLNSGRGYTDPPRVTAYIDTTVYPAPRVVAQLEPIMSLDSVIGVKVLNPGEGYAVLPTIQIDPAFTITFNSTSVNVDNSTIEIEAPLLQTGDLLIYNIPAGSTKIGGLVDGQKYYVGVLETTPSTVIALYDTYFTLLNDHDRVPLTSQGSGTQTLKVGAVASCITSSIPTRENSITLRYDRTSYTSQVIEWEPSGYYGSFYAGSFNDSLRLSSSSISLEASSPPISSVLASAQGVGFSILDVENNQTLTWSSRTRDTIQTYDNTTLYPNAIRINPSTGGSSVDALLGSTLGFYVGMPVKFVGSIPAGSPIVSSTPIGVTPESTTIYYVKSLLKLPKIIDAGSFVFGKVYTIVSVGNTDFVAIGASANTVGVVFTATGTGSGTGTASDATLLEDTGFTISATVDTDGVPGATFSLTTATVGTAGLTLYVGELTNTAIMTVNYNGIRTVTGTSSTNNIITIPLNAIGENGTTGFYQGLPIFFTGNVFGGVVENDTYYVTTVIDLQNFTMSTINDPLVLTATATNASGYAITCNTTLGLSVNDPIIFTGTTFGGIVEGTIYYVRELFSGNSTFSISASVNGSAVVLTTDSGSCTVTSQVDTVVLTTSTGSMTLNMGLPVSPGQVNGQQFTLYKTSGEYTSVSGTVSNLIERNITATLATVNRVCLTTNSGGITNIYTNMDFDVASNIGGLTTSGGPYTVTGTGTTSITVTATFSNNRLRCTDTDILYEGMPIYFSGTSLGGVSLDEVYYVLDIVNSTDFTISESPAGSEFDTLGDSGSMTGTGEPYLTVADTLSDATGLVTLTQSVGTTPTFNVSYILGGYQAVVATAGTGYAETNIITILGTAIGGTTPTNNLSLQVSAVNSSGGILGTIASGAPAGATEQYYVKVYSETQLELYENSNLTVAVSGLNFPYTGITTTTATVATASNNRFTVGSSAGFNLNDSVVFTGTVFGGVTLGETYYILAKPTSTTVTISTSIGGTVFDITADDTGSMSMAKAGDFALLPEPFFFDASVVKYNNRLYQCIISNNDQDFIFGKWELLQAGNYNLNALDRIVGYYKPNKTNTEAWAQYINMPGDDLTQLVSGITYPNATYLGNPFAPADEFTLDTILTDRPFYATGLDLKAVIWNGTTYISAADTTSYTSLNVSANSVTWAITQLSNSTINVTDMIFNGLYYVMTCNNSATPVLTSTDGINWSTITSYTPYGLTATTIPLSLNSIVYQTSLPYVAVGNTILICADVINLAAWTEVYRLPTTATFNGNPVAVTNVLNGVTYAHTTGYTGFVAVGLGQTPSGSNLVNVALIYTSVDGITWNQVTFNATTYGFNAIASNGQTIAAVGDHGIIYTSTNAITWFAQSSGTVRNLTNIIWDSVNNVFVALGENGVILTSDIFGITWTARTSGTTETLESVVWNNDDSEYVVVGLNNTVLRSTDLTTWTSTSNFVTPEAVYTVQGDAFTAGYGPEEMVPGIVSDTITMITNTRPGSNWDETIYQHVGYGVVSLELTPTSGNQVEYSFVNATIVPTQVSVFVIDYATGLSTTLYEGIDYSVDWINKIVTLDTPINYITPGTDTLRIDVYEVGNGDQLVKANTETDPIRLNSTTGFHEIYVNANYTAGIYQGSGVIRPTTEPLKAIALLTNGTSDAITCDSVENFVLNSPITFSGTVFGNIVEDQVYYVKSISGATNRITISLTVNGDTFALADATGSMTAIIQVGTGIVWTPPAMYHNGSPLTLGTTSIVTRTKSTTNTITTNSTGTMVPNQSIVFSNTMFGDVIVPQQVYYVKTVYDANEFTVSETQGGDTLELSDATGGAIFITNDYAIGLADNGVTASIMLAADYDVTIDYLAYTLMGETLPIQYGYTLPIVETFVGDAVGTASFTLTNYLGGTNPTNAIVEINGVRQNNSAYTINDINNTILFYSPPSDGDVISVTTYNLTDRQYFNTQYNITSSGAGVASITISNTTATAIPFDYSVLAGSFVIGQLYTIQSLNDDAYPTPGANTNFTLIGASSNTVGVTFTATGPGTGTGSAIIAGNGFDATQQTVLQTAGSFVLTNVYSIVTLGTTTNTQWNTIAGTSGVTYSVGSTFTCANIGTGLGNGTAYAYSSGLYSQSLYYLTLASGTTSSLIINSSIVFENVIGGIVAGQTYYITEILNSTDFVISSQVGGLPYEVTTDSGAMTSVVGELTVSNIVGIDNSITTPVAITVSGTIAADDSVICSTTSNLTVGQDIIFKAAIIGVTEGIVNSYQYQIIDLGTTTNAEWNDIALTSGVTYEVGSTFTVLAASAAAGTGTVLLTNLGGISTLGEVYFVRALLDSTHFTIEDQYGNIIELTDTSGNSLYAYSGGLVAVRVITGIDHGLTENSLIRIDGVVGSTQLNNNTYYARIISNTEFDLYTYPYNPAYGAINYPVVAISAYISGGYAWLDQLFTIATTVTIGTNSTNNRIAVQDGTKLIHGTPVYFTQFGATQNEDILGNILAQHEYYVYEITPATSVDDFVIGYQYQILELGDTDWNFVAGTVDVDYVVEDIITVEDVDSGTTGVASSLQEFTISETRYPNESIFAVTTATGVVNVSQFQQINVDRLWVTVNGLRVPASSLRLNEYNNLSILTTIQTGDVVIITSMMPTATPNEETYLLNVTTSNQPSVYRANSQTRTWLTHPLEYTDTLIYLNDVSRITDTIVQDVTCPVAVDGLYNIGLTSNKNVICHLTVYNNTTSTLVDPVNYSTIVVDTAPILQISAQVSVGDSLTITSVEGRLLYVNGEQIGFRECDLTNNTVSDLQRGTNGTGTQTYIPLYSEAYGLVPNNRMTDVLYSSAWNSYVYNTVEGDPLQISDTLGAGFLRTDRT